MIHYENRWAVVTGASSGLGRQFAARLADRGMSLVLTGRNKARLDEVASQIHHAATQVQIETLAADLSTPSGVSVLLDHVRDRPVEVLSTTPGLAAMGGVSRRGCPGSRVAARNARPRQRRDS